MTIEVDLSTISLPLQWFSVFGREAPTDVEIGSGKGRFLNERAAARPDRNILAVERAAKYHKLCCQRAAKRGLTNVRLLRTTAEDLLFRVLAPASVAKLFVLFPDPWPKKRHHKRRLFKLEVVESMVRVLEPGGLLLVKTDHPDYAEVIHEVLNNTRDLDRLDADEAFRDLPLTGFEQKYVGEGRPIRAFAMRREG